MKFPFQKEKLAARLVSYGHADWFCIRPLAPQPIWSHRADVIFIIQ